MQARCGNSLCQMKKIFVRLVCSLLYPLIGLWGYYWDLGRALERGGLDGGYSLYLFLGAVVTIILIMAIYLYFPVAEKIEPGSIVSYIGLFIVVVLLLFGWDIKTYEFSTDLERAWGDYMWWIGLWTPVIHGIAREQNRRYKWSFWGRPVPIEEGEEEII